MKQVLYKTHPDSHEHCQHAALVFIGYAALHNAADGTVLPVVPPLTSHGVLLDRMQPDGTLTTLERPQRASRGLPVPFPFAWIFLSHSNSHPYAE